MMYLFRSSGLLLCCLTAFAGCGHSQQPIKVGKSESAADAAARAAATLPPGEADEFLNTAELLAMHYQTKPANSYSESLTNTSVRAIEGKTPRQIIAEYNRLTPEQKAEANEIMQKARAERGC